MNLPNFWYGSCSYGLLWGNHTLYAWKVLIWWNFGHLRQKFGHFLAKIDCLRVFGLSASAERPMDSRLSVRASVRACVRHTISRKPRIRFLWFFAQSCILIKLKKCSKRIFEENSRVPPRGVFDPKTPLFGWKMVVWAYIFETPHQILMIFSQMLDIIALNDLASLLCTKKF